MSSVPCHPLTSAVLQRQCLSEPIPAWRPAHRSRDGVQAQVRVFKRFSQLYPSLYLVRTPGDQDKGYVSVVSTEEFNSMQQNGFHDGEEELDFTPQNGYHDAEVDIERVNSKGK